MFRKKQRPLFVCIGFIMLVLSWFFTSHRTIQSVQTDQLQQLFSQNIASKLPFRLRHHPPSESEYSYICADCATLPPSDTKYYTGPTNFMWPINGRIVGEYDDPNSEGLLIAAPIGSLVRASDDGEVVSASYANTLGMLVLIRHSNGFISIYGHNSELLVAKGFKVARGQVIAKSGQTGNVESPLLLFGLRHPEIGGGHEVLNPRIYL